MEKQKHTPRPWTIMKPEVFDADQAEDRLIVSKTDGKPQHIAEVFQYRNEQNQDVDGTAVANAHLIAAAPELLEACKWMMRELCEAWDETPEKAIPTEHRVAIAKAEGEDDGNPPKLG